MPMFDWAVVAVVSFCAIGRSTGIIVAKLRQVRYRAKATAYPSSWRDRCTQPEPFLLLAITLVLLVTHDAPNAMSPIHVVAAVAGAVLACVGISLMLWAVASFPTVSPGHYILPEHQIVDRGAFGWVRHPLYLAAFLIWAGVAAGFQNLVVLVILAAYVVPAYLIYIRSEERMMIGHFDADYLRYRERVPMLVPGRLPTRRGRTTPC